MKKAYYLKTNAKITEIANETYYDLLAAAKHRNPKAKSLIEDPELAQLHILLPFLRQGEIRVQIIEDEFILIEIYEEHQPFILKQCGSDKE